MTHFEISRCFRYRKKIMGLDFDHTIVKPKNNKTFPKDVDDWEWVRPNIPEIINNYYDKGFGIVVFTNQFKQFKLEQIQNVMDKIGCPYKAYIAFDKSIKKPNTFLFDKYKRDNIDLKNSMYVGDAMGRQQDWSDSDKQFALNCGLTPKTPEEIFPFEVKSSKKSGSQKIKPNSPDKQEMIIMVGFPGSGKTTITQQFEPLEHYDVLHGDDLKTESKIKKAIKNGLESGKSVIVDATNPSVKKRSVFLELAKRIVPDIQTRAIYLSTSMEESMFRNAQREKPIPKIAFYMFRKNFEMPTKEEGFDEVITV